MNEQLLFDTALKHIRKQKVPSVRRDKGGDIVCQYRSPEGYGCAFAPAIEDYSSDLEGVLADSIYYNYIERIKPEFRSVDMELARDIQKCHDNNSNSVTFLDNFEADMVKVAEKWDLEYSDDPFKQPLEDYHVG